MTVFLHTWTKHSNYCWTVRPRGSACGPNGISNLILLVRSDSSMHRHTTVAPSTSDPKHRGLTPSGSDKAQWKANSCLKVQSSVRGRNGRKLPFDAFQCYCKRDSSAAKYVEHMVQGNYRAIKRDHWASTYASLALHGNTKEVYMATYPAHLESVSAIYHRYVACCPPFLLGRYSM